MRADQFEAYGASHLLVVFVLVLGAYLLMRVGRAHRHTAAAEQFSRRFALVVAALLPIHVIQLLTDQFHIGRSLPLQLCDLLWFAAIYALWTRRPWAVSLTYYWGLTLSLQGVLTPDLTEDFPATPFFAFWALHLLVVWVPVYLTWGLGIRPTWRGYRRTVAMTSTWVVAMLCLNAAVGSNYGYLNEKPAQASILDLLGSWPLYVLVEAVLVAAVWALITLPWERVSARRRVSVTSRV